MTGAMRKFGAYLGLVAEAPRYDEQGYQEYDDVDQTAVYEPVPQVQQVSRPRSPQPQAQVAHLNDRRQGEYRRPTVLAQPVELSKIVTLNPRVYNDAKSIGENFREGVPVIINLNEMADEDAKRVVDFGAGLAFATFGSIERITKGVFLLSPNSVSVSAEDKARLVEDSFFNQS